MTNIVFNDMVQVMERGQITLPMAARKKLNLNKGSKLWFKLTDKDEVILNPVEKKKKSLAEFLEKMVNDQRSYWSDADTRRLERVREKSIERIRKLYE